MRRGWLTLIAITGAAPCLEGALHLVVEGRFNLGNEVVVAISDARQEGKLNWKRNGDVIDGYIIDCTSLDRVDAIDAVGVRVALQERVVPGDGLCCERDVIEDLNVARWAHSSANVMRGNHAAVPTTVLWPAAWPAASDEERKALYVWYLRHGWAFFIGEKDARPILDSYRPIFTGVRDAIRLRQLNDFIVSLPNDLALAFEDLQMTSADMNVTSRAVAKLRGDELVRRLSNEQRAALYACYDVTAFLEKSDNAAYRDIAATSWENASANGEREFADVTRWLESVGARKTLEEVLSNSELVEYANSEDNPMLLRPDIPLPLSRQWTRLRPDLQSLAVGWYLIHGWSVEPVVSCDSVMEFRFANIFKEAREEAVRKRQRVFAAKLPSDEAREAYADVLVEVKKVGEADQAKMKKWFRILQELTPELRAELERTVDFTGDIKAR